MIFSFACRTEPSGASGRLTPSGPRRTALTTRIARIAYRTAIATAMVGSAACAESGAALQDSAPPVGVPGPNATLRFEQEGTVAVRPGEVVPITVITTPPDNYELTFLLLGESLGASLDHTTLVAQDDGSAVVYLRAPDAATTFRLRASIKDGPSGDIAISVSDSGFGTVRVIPLYEGNRKATTWTAAVVAQTTCADIADVLPNVPDGALETSVPAGQNPEVLLAPVGPNLAVSIRAGQFMWGCTNESNLRAFDTTDVYVTVLDKPLDLTETNLSLSFDYQPNATQYQSLLSSAAQLMANTMFPEGAGDGSFLLDAMAATTQPAQQGAFDTARETFGWDAVADDHFAGLPDAVGPTIQALSAAGAANLDTTLTARLVNAGDAKGQGTLLVDTIGGVSADMAGIPSTHTISWSSQPKDVVLLGGTVFWEPSQYLGATAEIAAFDVFPSAANMSEALGTLTDCAGLSVSLGGYSGCDAACLEQQCVSGWAHVWAEGILASAQTGQFGTIDLALSGQAEVSNEAAPVSFAGTWVGKVKAAGLTADVSGQASAKLNDDVPR